MTTRKQHLDKMDKKKALGLLKEAENRIRKGEWIVETSGWWQGTPGTYTIRVVVKEKDVFVEESE